MNNAGIVKAGGIQNSTLLDYDTVMNTNVRSVYHLTMLCVPHLIQSKGSIINVSSVNGLRAVSFLSTEYLVWSANSRSINIVLVLPSMGPMTCNVNSSKLL